MLLSVKFKVVASLNAERLRLYWTANLKLTMFSGVQAVCPLPENEGLNTTCGGELRKPTQNCVS
jgi:hypothetical protein